jgi:pimeloyl-ACP methyl ester carboxylesterase
VAATEIVEIGDVHIAVHPEGPEQGEPVLLLHGLGSTAAVWEQFGAEVAAAGRRALAVDLRGHGESSWPGEGYDFDTMARDLIALSEHLRLGPAALVGHSMGGRVALHVALRRPDLVTRMVLAETPPPRLVAPPAEVPQRPAEPTPFDWAVVPAIRHAARRVDPGWWEWVATIEVPTLWLAGGPTSHVPQELIAAASARMPDSRVVTIADAGHSVVSARPAEFAAAALAFLR